MIINNKNDLKVAYEILSDLKEREQNERINDRIKNLKRNIREYQRKENNKSKARIVKDDGIDGYTELKELPETLLSIEEAEEYFEEYECISCRPSIYDCTGQAFTAWYKVFERRGKMMAYHMIVFDV